MFCLETFTLAIILITEKKQRNKNQQITVEYLTKNIRNIIDRLKRLDFCFTKNCLPARPPRKCFVMALNLKNQEFY